jgi:cytochrome c biogenesis protein CcmG/thiol:disulfide interchange protein DsbE
MSRFTFFAPLGAFAVILATFAFSLRNDPHKMPSMLIDKAAPAFALASLYGDREAGLSSEDLKGAPSLLNVFASWCPACRVEHPFLMRLANSRKFKIVGIDWKDGQQKGQRWLAEHQSPYSRVGFDESGRVGVDFGVTGVPETFIVDTGGRVRYRHAGPLTEEAWREVIEPLLTQLRSEP